MKRNDIVEAAFKEFSSYSYDSASVNRIIQESHTSKGTFYHYFLGKEDLYEHLADTVLQKKIQFFRQTEPVQKQKTLFDILRFQLDSSIEFGFVYPEYSAFIIRVRKDPNEHVRKKILDRMGMASNDFYVTLIKERIDIGEVRDDVPPEFTAGIISYFFTHFFEYLQTIDCEISPHNRADIRKQYRYLISILEGGIAAK